MHTRNWLQLLLLFQVGVYCALSLAGSRGVFAVWRTYRYTLELRAQLARAHQACSVREREVQEFRAAYDFFVEKYARERLHMARATDRVVVL